MLKTRIKPIATTLLCLIAVSISGCSEGFLWRTGHLSPWVKQKWEEEEKIASTLISRKQRMTDAVQMALNGQTNQRDQVAASLQEIVFRDPVLLLRLHAVELLGDLDSPTAIAALGKASQDRNADIRTAAVKSLGKTQDPAAIPLLQEVIGGDTNVDVRLAATKAIGFFPANQSIDALSMVLDDSNPALQVAATESLQKVTGKDLGADVFAWKQFVAETLSDSSTDSRTATAPKASESTGSFRR